MEEIERKKKEDNIKIKELEKYKDVKIFYLLNNKLNLIILYFK